MTVEPIFNFSVPDWDYHAMIAISLLVGPPIFSERSEVDILAMLYTDGHVKSTTRVLFASGNKHVISKEFPGKTQEAAIQDIIDSFRGFPGIQKDSYEYEVIMNNKKDGQNLFNLILQSPRLKFNFRPIEE